MQFAPPNADEAMTCGKRELTDPRREDAFQPSSKRLLHLSQHFERDLKGMLIEASEAATVAGSPDENRAKGSNQLRKESWRSQDPECFRRRKLRPLVAGRAQGATGISRGRARLCLVIDNDWDRGRVLAAALAKLGYAVECASDGQEGRKSILANRPNLVS